MCEVCHEIENRMNTARLKKNKYYTVLTLSLNELVTEKNGDNGSYQTNIISTTIKYCPKCGRRFKD